MTSFTYTIIFIFSAFFLAVLRIFYLYHTNVMAEIENHLRNKDLIIQQLENELEKLAKDRMLLLSDNTYLRKLLGKASKGN